MIRDLRSLPDGARIVADVCVIGAGPAGLTLARALGGTHTRVVVLESGGHSPDPQTADLDRGEAVGLPFRGLTEGRARALGGTSHLWAGQCLRLTPTDFDVRPWVPHSGWPITAADLDEHYAAAESLLGIAPADPDATWRRFGITPPDLGTGELEHRVTAFTPRWAFGPRARRALAGSSDVDVLLHATVSRIHADGAAVGHLEVRTSEGRRATVVASTVVLCAGGIENARLLLVSGLGNEYDVVGRYFQEHPKLFSGPLRTDDLDRVRRTYGMVRHGRVRYVPKAQLDPQLQRSQQVLGAAAGVTFEQSAGTASARALADAVRGRARPADLGVALRGVGADAGRVAVALAHRWTPGPMTAPWPSGARVNVLLEQAPNPASRVRLGDGVDALGVPRAAVDWRLTDLERRTADTVLRALDAAWSRLGIGSLADAEWSGREDWASHAGEVAHHMGTTRMALDPRHGVVDPDCRVHGVRGLYVCGSSVFPTSGHANPTLTIMALALRLAAHLRGR